MSLLDLRRAPAPDPSSEPAEAILACHAKIRAFLTTGERLADAAGAPLEEIASAAAGVRRYFAQALPLHERDEEESVTPRLLASPARARLEDAIATMVGEHAATHAILDEIDPLWARLAVSPDQLPVLRARLTIAQRALSHVLTTHLEAEERAIVPAITSELSPADRAAIALEIRARRR